MGSVSVWNDPQTTLKVIYPSFAFEFRFLFELLFVPCNIFIPSVFSFVKIFISSREVPMTL